MDPIAIVRAAAASTHRLQEQLDQMSQQLDDAVPAIMQLQQQLDAAHADADVWHATAARALARTEAPAIMQLQQQLDAAQTEVDTLRTSAAAAEARARATAIVAAPMVGSALSQTDQQELAAFRAERARAEEARRMAALNRAIVYQADSDSFPDLKAWFATQGVPAGRSTNLTGYSGKVWFYVVFHTARLESTNLKRETLEKFARQTSAKVILIAMTPGDSSMTAPAASKLSTGEPIITLFYQNRVVLSAPENVDNVKRLHNLMVEMDV